MLQEMRIVDQCERVLHYLIRDQQENYEMVNQWEMMEGKGFCLFPIPSEFCCSYPFRDGPWLLFFPIPSVGGDRQMAQIYEKTQMRCK